MVNRHMKRCSTLLVISEIFIKTTMKYHLTAVRMATLKSLPKKKCSKEYDEKREPSYAVGGSVNLFSHYGEQYRIP